MAEIDTTYKGYKTVPSYGSSVLEIRSIGQGPVPDALKGMFTTVTEARKSIDAFLKLKETGNGKTRSGDKG